MRRLALVAVLTLPLAACDSGNSAMVPTTEFITQRRAWLPGERDSLIARIIVTRALSIPYVGDMSDYASSFYSLDSLDEVVPNPAFSVAAGLSPFGPTFSLSGLRVPGAGWTSSAIDVHVVNANQANDTFDRLGVFWVNQGEPMWKGFVIAATANTTFPATTVNTTNFDLNNAKVGVGAGEGRFSTATVWTANGTGAPNQFSVSSSAAVGGTATITTGPFLGGTQQSMNMTMNINNVGMTRVLGAGAPATQTASLSGNVTGTKFVCLFPTPCTTNVPVIAAAVRHGLLPDSLRSQLPWTAARMSVRR